MPAPQFINGKPVTYYHEVQNQSALIAASTNGTQICTLTTLRGMKAFIIRLSQAWDPAIDTFVTWYARVNQTKRFPYEGSTVQISAPESDAYIVPLEVPEGTQVEIMADVGAAPSSGKITGRLGIAYIDKD